MCPLHAPGYGGPIALARTHRPRDAVLILPVSADAEALGGFGFTATSKTGGYSVRGLPAGDYHVLVVDFERPDLAEGFYRAGAPGNFTAKESKATAVHVGP